MELVRPEQITSRGRTPEEVTRAAATCDKVLELLADEADQGLARGIIDERLHLLGSVATQPRATPPFPVDRTATDTPSVPAEITSERRAGAAVRSEPESPNGALILCMALNLVIWAAVLYGGITLVRWAW